MATIDARLAALGAWVGEVADAACEGCKNQKMVMLHDATCYQTCETFAAEVERLEKE